MEFVNATTHGLCGRRVLFYEFEGMGRDGCCCGHPINSTDLWIVIPRLSVALPVDAPGFRQPPAQPDPYLAHSGPYAARTLFMRSRPADPLCTGARWSRPV